MRYDKCVYFVKDGEATYDAATGNYTEEDPVKTLRMASVMDTSTETMRLLYGEIRQGSLTIQLQNHYDAAFNRIEYDGQAYAVDLHRRLRTKDTYVVSEVP